MKKRNLLTGLAGLMSFMALPVLAKAEAAPVRKSNNRATWTVPKGIDKIRISSTGPDGNKIFSRELSVEPGQTFFVEAI